MQVLRHRDLAALWGLLNGVENRPRMFVRTAREGASHWGARLGLSAKWRAARRKFDGCAWGARAAVVPSAFYENPPRPYFPAFGGRRLLGPDRRDGAPGGSHVP